jgi:hypothetical protein
MEETPQLGPGFRGLSQTPDFSTVRDVRHDRTIVATWRWVLVLIHETYRGNKNVNLTTGTKRRIFTTSDCCERLFACRSRRFPALIFQLEHGHG